MIYGMYLSAEGAAAQNRRVEVLANNMANVNTPGFKRELAVLQARHAEAIIQGLDTPGSRSINDLGGGVEVADVVTDHSQGALRQTGIPTDLAINGEGYFVVKRGDEELLTRAGNFTLDGNGALVTSAGDPVLSEDGAPILGLRNPDRWQMLPGGIINDGGLQVRLKLVRPAAAGDLARAGENLFRPLAQTTNVPAGERSIVNKFLEMSAVHPVREMTELIAATRAFEANVKMIQNQDQVTGELLSRVLRSG